MCAMRRRDFMKLGGLAAAAGALPLLRGSPVFGAPGALPRRVVFVYFGDGLLLGDGEPKPPAGMSAYDENNWEFPACLAPLAAFKADTIMLDNLDMISANEDPTMAASAHIAGESHALAAGRRINDTLPDGASIDQFIAQKIGGQTSLRSLEIFSSADMAYNNGFKGPKKIAATSGAGQQVDALGRPEEIFDRVFGKAPPTSGEPVDNSALMARQKRLFDFLRGQHGEVATRLPSADRNKIDQHLQYLSDIEAGRKLMLDTDRQSLFPDRSMVADALGLNWEYNAADAIWGERYQVASTLNMKLVAAALHADVTRVATIALDPPPADNFGFSDGMYGATDWHDLIHKVNDPNASHAKDPKIRELVIKVLTDGIDKVRVLAEELATLREVDGSRMLDHTVIVFTSQIGYGNHQLERLPWFTIGNANGYFRTGRTVTFPRVTDAQDTWRTNGRPHNDLFVTIANAMGIDTNTFGRADVCTGPIAEMRG